MKRRLLPLSATFLCLLLAGCAASGARFTPAATRVETAQSAARQIVVTVRNGGSHSTQSVGTSGKAYGALGRYQPSPAALRDAEDIARRHRLRQIAAWPIEVLDVHCVVYAVDDARQIEAVLTEVAADRVVESAQAMTLFRTQGGGHYDDPYLQLQDGIAVMQVEEAHRVSRGRGVRIAVVDSAVDGAHPDLARRVVLARDVTGSPATAGETHGTAVAGIIAADAGNGLGIVGIAPEARILALRACWQEAGGNSVCNTLSLAQALATAIAERADIINLSLTGPRDALLERLLLRALAMGKVIVTAVPEVAAEREGFPANLAGVLAVASAEVAASAGNAAALYAPGRQILTLRPGGRYDFENGSSMAAASVSGVVALLLAREPSATPARIRQLLQTASLRLAVTTPASAPVVNACLALAALSAGMDCAPLRRMHATRQ